MPGLSKRCKISSTTPSPSQTRTHTLSNVYYIEDHPLLQATVNLVCCSWQSLYGKKPSRWTLIQSEFRRIDNFLHLNIKLLLPLKGQNPDRGQNKLGGRLVVQRIVFFEITMWNTILIHKLHKRFQNSFNNVGLRSHLKHLKLSHLKNLKRSHLKHLKQSHLKHLKQATAP